MLRTCRRRAPPAAFLPAVIAAAAGAFALVFASPSRAQEQRGQVTVAVPRDPATATAGTLSLLDRATGALVPLSNQPLAVTELSALAASPWQSNRFFGASDGRLNLGAPNVCGIWRIDAAAGAVAAAVRVNATPLVETWISHVAVGGDYVYWLGQASLGRVDLATGACDPFRPLAASEGAFGLAVDGRWLYAALTARDVFRIDLRDRATTVHVIAVPGMFLDTIGALAVTPAGRLLAATGDPLAGCILHEIDPGAGTLLRSLPLPLASPSSIVPDAHTGEALVAGRVASGAGALAVVTPAFTAGPLAFASATNRPAIAWRGSAPLHRSRFGCAAGDGRDPFLDGNGPPLRGTATWALTLRTRPALAAFLAGGLRPAPGQGGIADLGPFGAPGCTFAVQTSATVLVVTDAVGFAQQPIAIPNVASLRDAAFDFQAAVLDPTANALGVALSSLGSVVVD